MAIILVIDEDSMQLEALIPLLEAEGHLVHHAANRGRAFQILDEEAIDLIIIDPERLSLNGLQFCRQLRELNPARPILVASRSDDENAMVQALAAGADDYLVKPASTRLLLARIEALLRRIDEQVNHADRHFAAVRRMLDAAWQVPLKPSLRTPYPELARSLGGLRSTYCRFAVREGVGRLRIKASAGHRTGIKSADDRSFSLDVLPMAAAALREPRSVAIVFDRPDPGVIGERELLFTRLTRSAALIPFGTDRVEGLLIVGEERQTRHDPFEGEHLALLEYVAHRIADILRMTDLIRRVRIAERRRQLQVAKRVERTRLARELHDEVGQSLSGLLIRLRLARTEGALTAADLAALEQAAQNALDAARSVAYDLRHRSGATDAFSDARAFAEQVLYGAGGKLAWIDKLETVPDLRTARIAARVIKESVTNVVRHARAHSTEVKLEEGGRHLRVTIQDDGDGFVPGTVLTNRKGRGLGLLGNRERVEEAGGQFRVESFPGAGTSVVFELPLRRRLTIARAV